MYHDYQKLKIERLRDKLRKNKIRKWDYAAASGVEPAALLQREPCNKLAHVLGGLSANTLQRSIVRRNQIFANHLGCECINLGAGIKGCRRQYSSTRTDALIRQSRETGKQKTLRLLLSEDAPVGIIDSDDVGILAAHLLVAEDVTWHNKAKYGLNGPENMSGRHIVAIAQEYLGTKVETVAYKDTSFIGDMAAQSNESLNVSLSTKQAADTAWEGKCEIDTTSKEVFNMAAPKRTPAQVFKALLDE